MAFMNVVFKEIRDGIYFIRMSNHKRFQRGTYCTRDKVVEALNDIYVSVDFED
jgi:hypothetical protein